MGYCVRAFCTFERVPTIKEILDWVKTQGYELEVAPDFKDSDLNTDKWEQIGIIYKKGKLPFLSEVNVDDGSVDCLIKDEIEEFKEFLEEVNGLLNWNKKKVLKHLSETKYIIANQIPTSDFDDDGYNANGEFLNYFVKYCGGMIQADGEGFYEGNKLIVKLD